MPFRSKLTSWRIAKATQRYFSPIIIILKWQSDYLKTWDEVYGN